MLSVEDVREIYATLGILEGAAAAAVVTQLDDADLRELRQFNRQMATAAANGDWQAFGLWNRRFHEVFLLKLDNRTLRDTCNLVRGPLYIFPIPRQTSSAWLRKSVAEHRAIIRLVEARDAEALGAYFRDVHWGYERNRQFIRDAFDHTLHVAKQRLRNAACNSVLLLGGEGGEMRRLLLACTFVLVTAGSRWLKGRPRASPGS